ncbi:MAG: anti-sigma factor [Rhizobiaceae bacterium]|nr:anti-sigma factor [Rhizobiaceae bacterium]
MSLDDGQTHEPEGGDDMVAAEYVLGTLPAAERAAAARRIETEQDFARTVDRWEVRLAPMAAAYAEVDAPAAAKLAIDRRLFGSTPPQGQTGGIWQNLAFWRGLAGFAVAAMLVLALVPLLTPPAPLSPPARLAASLADPASGVQYLVVYDASRGEIGLSHVSGDAGAGDFELWLIEGGNAPASLGVIPDGASTHLTVAEAHRTLIAPGAVFAISLEPAGGSATGQPTGPVVAAGDLRTI